MNQHLTNFCKNLIAYAIQRDVSAETLADLAGVDWPALKAGQPVSITLKQLNDLWLHAVRLSKDALFGLHLGETMQVSALGLVGAVIRNSATVGEALQHCAEFPEQVSELFAMRVTNKQSSFLVELHSCAEKHAAYPVAQKHFMECSMAFLLHELDGLLFAKMQPLWVEMPYERASLSELQRVLRCNDVRPAQWYRMEFDNTSWDERVIAADFSLQEVLLQKVRRLQEQQEAMNTLEARIRVMLENNSYLGVPSLQQVASNLHMSARSVQRRLKEEGVSFGEITESVRKTMAAHYLQGSGYPLKEISYLLGYNELSAFSRAFKKWTGSTPLDYRRARLGAA
jgi:AraC-like DNA-binding protein